MQPDASIAFMRAARGQKLGLREIAERAGLTMDEARDILSRGYRAGRLTIHDEDRQNIWIEVKP
ncbi:hypothetical protein SAMN04489859_102035 [Paracoccus alcaliphilus]|uniref:Uncharacterized protein n=1 Tax=Paracoccus alcaliphilus TaxID=34002 RepID=A0A1H8K4Q4_9RHOB|nr:hypothetical protein [Paracoccus alcaliphilus]WCR17531.1 hypothetical protein JHW40_14510 [Paracoccus alcaliphilus]SEN87476.1 hypothetical protein SAMN04489859_102035 [Paracoccus alcaliphilus]